MQAKRDQKLAKQAEARKRDDKRKRDERDDLPSECSLDEGSSGEDSSGQKDPTPPPNKRRQAKDKDSRDAYLKRAQGPQAASARFRNPRPAAAGN
jgi:hypothetical protein